MAQRKIKHYPHGYLSKKRRRKKQRKVVVFVLLFAVLVFLGYQAAHVIGKMDWNHLTKPSDLPSSEPASSSQAASLPPEASSDPESKPEEPFAIRAIAVPSSVFLSAEQFSAFLESVDTSRYNSVLLELKDAKGTLYYPSQSPLATACEAISPAAVPLAELTETVRAHGLQPIARIYALQDDIASHARYNTSYLYQNQSITWLDNAPDNGGKSWLNPYLPDTTDYLTELVAEIATAGFDAIVVNGMQYPATTDRSSMGYGSGADLSAVPPAQALTDLLGKLQQTAEETDALLIPAFLGECYLGERSHIYGASPDTLWNGNPVSPILTNNRNQEILDAVTTVPELLIPTISDASALTLLSENGIDQYVVESE